ncbi:hypothetical protein D3C81_1013830 [compost metagenome]
MATAPVVTNEQQRLVLGVTQQGVFLAVAERCAGHFFGQGIGLEHDVAVGLRVFFPELGAEEGAGQAIAAGQGQAVRQAHVGAAQQAVAHGGGKAAAHRRSLDEVFIDASVGVLLAQWLDQPWVPAGVHQAEAPGIDEQRQLVEPLDEVVPVTGVVGELGQGFVDQPGMAWRVLAHIGLATAGQCRGDPAQGVVFVVAHDAERLAGLDHVVDDVQRLANAWPAVDDVAKEQRLAPRVAPHAGHTLVTEGVEQAFKGQRTAMHVTDDVETSRRIEHQSSLLPRRLPQPSLVRQTS